MFSQMETCPKNKLFALSGKTESEWRGERREEGKKTSGTESISNHWRRQAGLIKDSIMTSDTA